MQKSIFAGAVVTIVAFLVAFKNADAHLWFPLQTFIPAEVIMAKADSNGDGVLTLKEANAYLELYGLVNIPLGGLDANEDGNLSSSEVNHGITDDAMSHADKNHDGLVSLYETTLFLSEHGVHVQKKDLKKYDKDNDTFLSVDEANRLPQQLFASPMNRVLKTNLQEGLLNTTNAEIWKNADSNSDGRLSLIELATALTDHGNYQVNAFDLMRIDLDHDAFITVDEIEEFRD